MTMYGWTIQQWGLAAARFPGYTPDRDGVIKLREAWGALPAPGTLVLEGVKYPEDQNWAVEAMVSVATISHWPLIDKAQQ